MRWLPDIRYGTERYPEKVARRLRALNLAVWIFAVVASGFAVARLLDPTPDLWKVGAINAVAAVLCAAIPLLHRFGHLAAPIAATIVGFFYCFVVTFLLGTGTGMQMYYLVGAALALLYLGTERIVLAGVFGAVAAACIIALEVLVPYDTGLEPALTLFGNYVATVIVSCAIILTIVFYVLREEARAEAATKREAEQVAIRNRFIRETFGRYLSNEVVATLLESPTGLEIGGEKRKITMMMADLRGFTSLSERLAPERVVEILNRYFGTMVKIITRHQGTIDEFIGDAIFVLFGAPVRKADDAGRAVACAVEMQRMMASVNEQNRSDGLPEIEMGIGLHTGEVVVGNIGSPERMKYGVVGSHVNLTSRIQSHTIGGQILISEAVRREVGLRLRLGTEMQVRAKGFDQPIVLSEVLGVGDLDGGARLEAVPVRPLHEPPERGASPAPPRLGRPSADEATGRPMR